MEWYDVFRVFSLVAVWAIPAILIVALGAFIILAPVFTSAGVVLRLHEVVHDKLVRRGQAEAQPLIDMGLACSIDGDCPSGYVCVNGKCVPAT